MYAGGAPGSRDCSLSLTGSLFLGLVVVATAAAFVAAVLVLPRFSASRPKPVIARVSMLLLVNCLVLLTAAVVLNDQFTFYADWTDLRGAMFGGGVKGPTAYAGGPAARAARIPVGAASTQATPRMLPSLPPGAGSNDRVLRFTVTGPRSGLRAAVLVMLPQGYTKAANSTRRYPVLETFPGYPGDPSQWIDSMNLGGVLDKAVADHVAGPAVIVSPTTQFPPGVDTECVNGASGQPQVETWLTQDVPDWVLHTFRVRTERASWATVGLSEGGWCAAMAAMLHPERYAAAVVMGGYFAPEFSPSYRPFRRGSRPAQRYDLVALAEHRPPPVALWLETSHSDTVSYPSTAKLLAVAHDPLSIQALILRHAGHRLSLWSGELPQVVAWLGRNIPGFAP